MKDFEKRDRLIREIEVRKHLLSVRYDDDGRTAILTLTKINALDFDTLCRINQEFEINVRVLQEFAEQIGGFLEVEIV
jgi:hypothetical protein